MTVWSPRDDGLNKNAKCLMLYKPPFGSFVSKHLFPPVPAGAPFPDTTVSLVGLRDSYSASNDLVISYQRIERSFGFVDSMQYVLSLLAIAKIPV